MKKVLFMLALSGVSSAVFAADLAPSCQKYFSEYEGYLKSVPQAQADMFKQQYEQAKSQFSSLPESAQTQACDQALQQLKQMQGK
ncbi:DUF5339 domain-containing protein [Avibacterium avium]|uniref:DUF5339 domain-containing protein n=2 Tax=Avibacterium avium TaxID=751 RepID=UPI0039FD6346